MTSRKPDLKIVLGELIKDVLVRLGVRLADANGVAGHKILWREVDTSSLEIPIHTLRVACREAPYREASRTQRLQALVQPLPRLQLPVRCQHKVTVVIRRKFAGILDARLPEGAVKYGAEDVKALDIFAREAEIGILPLGCLHPAVCEQA